MKPTKNNVLVEKKEQTLSTSSGIILKRAIDDDRAIVKAIGPDVTEVSVNDEVILNWNSAIKVEDSLYIIPVEEIIMVIED